MLAFVILALAAADQPDGGRTLISEAFSAKIISGASRLFSAGHICHSPSPNGQFNPLREDHFAKKTSGGSVAYVEATGGQKPKLGPRQVRLARETA
ncbi:hypothetical protein ACIBSV_49520 [Embleya sp. NPDC050154]|uniref:hypothetical protein n=1 Tax=unclassified Embleya TaxID=2699296 RepID=UPI0037A05D1D